MNNRKKTENAEKEAHRLAVLARTKALQAKHDAIDSVVDTTNKAVKKANGSKPTKPNK